MTKNKKKRGVTIPEAVVAMLIIVIVSASAITMLSSFSKQSAKMLQRNEALTLAENALECFKVSKTCAQFSSYLSSFSSEEIKQQNYEYFTKKVPSDPNDPSSPKIDAFEHEAGAYNVTATGFTASFNLRFYEDVAYCNIYVADESGRVIFRIDNYTKAVV